ncbi:hypothetical protein L596_010198 [Steinernema carpocapsae]|uniref:C-type lectin domain-containing protein n=1 Tax=Steinernema carpocapsae TaxID=34508 RepID=A0A4V6A6Y6_STECR|nr:hypothetical protein L596_010198 [Steinernema carpocapsae]
MDKLKSIKLNKEYLTDKFSYHPLPDARNVVVETGESVQAREHCCRRLLKNPLFRLFVIVVYVALIVFFGFQLFKVVRSYNTAPVVFPNFEPTYYPYRRGGGSFDFTPYNKKLHFFGSTDHPALSPDGWPAGVPHRAGERYKPTADHHKRRHYVGSTEGPRYRPTDESRKHKIYWNYPGVRDMSFDDAERFCQNRRKHLASIHSMEELQDIAKWGSKKLGYGTEFWVGGKAINNYNDEFAWTDDSVFDFFHYYPDRDMEYEPRQCLKMEAGREHKMMQQNDCEDELSVVCVSYGYRPY